MSWSKPGNTVVVIEHNLEVIKTADWIIDLGPEGGDGGGQLVAVGTPEDVAANKASYTGQFLAELLKRRGAAAKKLAPRKVAAGKAPVKKRSKVAAATKTDGTGKKIARVNKPTNMRR